MSLTDRYARSLEHLARAEQVIPLGAQTFSKSRTQYPVGAAPHFAVRSAGSHTWDIDGNEYVDLVSSLGAVVLGYADPEIDEAVVRQLRDGVTLSLSHPIEAEVAERMVDLIPCAEKVRFGKNGSDATSAAIRLARSYTGRSRVVALTVSVPYNDAPALAAVLAEGDVAAVIMEPMTSTWPAEGYLAEVRRLTREAGTVLVFDEMLTGFRFAPGGAQEYFGVTPDLAAFGKALANGMPLSAIVGRADILDEMPRIFFSGTYGGETLSLAAARVVLDRMATGEPTRMLAQTGQELVDLVDAQRPAASRDVLEFVGHPSWIFHRWSIEDDEVLAQAKTLLLQEMLRRGVLVLATHDVTTAFTQADLEVVARAYAESLGVVMNGLERGDLLGLLECEPIRPLFRVRS